MSHTNTVVQNILSIYNVKKYFVSDTILAFKAKDYDTIFHQFVLEFVPVVV